MAEPSSDREQDPRARDDAAEPVPERVIRDPRVLRALAHPVRLGILEELATAGPATATELAERLGETAANCSYHLRQLARFGFIEEGEGRRGRQRPWRLVQQASRVPEAAADEAELARASDALMDVLLAREVEVLRRWLATRQQAPRQWRDASLTTTSWDYLTPGELADFKRDLRRVFERHLLPHADRIDPARRPPDATPVRFVAWAIPAGTPPEPRPEASGDDR